MSGHDETPKPASEPEILNLKQVAAALEVHYMTAYRYVRTGQLPAVRGTYGWEIASSDLAAMMERLERPEAQSPARSKEREVDWVGELAATLASGDEVAAWRIIERALSSTYSPQECLIDLIPAALSVCTAPANGIATLADDYDVAPYLAFSVTRRIVARLGARFRRPGRSRGVIVLGSPSGESHEVPVTILADFIRLEGFTCIELGAGVPAQVFANAILETHIQDSQKLLGVAFSLSWSGHAGSMVETVNHIRAFAPELPILIGGQGVLNPEIATLLGANMWAADFAELSARLNDLVALQPSGGHVIGQPVDQASRSSHNEPNEQATRAINPR